MRQTLAAAGRVCVVAHRLRSCGMQTQLPSSVRLTRDQALVPCLSRQVLNHWATGKSLQPLHDLSLHFWPPTLLTFSSHPQAMLLLLEHQVLQALGPDSHSALYLDTLHQLSSASVPHFIQIPSCLRSSSPATHNGTFSPLRVSHFP